MRENDVRDRGLSGLATLEAVTTAGIAPDIMGYAPVIALERLWAQTGLTPADVDVVELNEAFAAQAVAVIRDANLDPAKTNPYGGASRSGTRSGRREQSSPFVPRSTVPVATSNMPLSRCASAAGRPVRRCFVGGMPDRQEGSGSFRRRVVASAASGSDSGHVKASQT
ncbi:hypothetical protein [Microbacterium sp. CPCC 204701]|uniref:hypothetical protein n=1 Tax=Microbacterium sp. CPCC 204701 TaxID=2493084 RepID=UPI00406C6177